MKEPKEVLVINGQIIKIYDETDYDFNSSGNTKTYDKTFLNGDSNILTSKIGVELFEGDKFKSSCLIASAGGGTGVFKNSVIVQNDNLLLCCANSIFCITIPKLDLKWKTVSDSATCFSIHNLNEHYIVHGELQITRLDENGNIIWQKSGRDIWVTAEGINDFVICDNFILATDWDYFRYKFDFNGNLIEEFKVEQKNNR